ncbi:MAG: TIGR02281 family clan AA aspartic protease [Gammaproteobacteria bacterium]|nr:TIGR02281 family clan AA aspartic protease [Gammaproteobacteria bacterium]
MTEPQPDPSQQKAGQWMYYAAWASLLLLLFLYFSDREERAFNPNQDPNSRRFDQVSEVVLQQNRGGHYVSSGYINLQPVVFFLDTGATTVAVPEPVARTLGLRRGREFEVHTANGIGRAYATQLSSLQIGSIELYNIEAAIVPNMPGDEILLGMSALRQLEFSQQGRELILRQVN